MNYESYTTEQFLDDPFFIRWVKYSAPEADQFWNSWMNTGPANLQQMKEAEQQLRVILSANRIIAEKEVVEEVWSGIKGSLPAESKRVIRIIPGFRLWQAAILVLGLSLGYFFIIHRPSHQPAAVSQQKTKDILPGSNKAILTLGDGTAIILDSAKNGVLAQQSGTQILKTGTGQLAYSASRGKTAEMLYNKVSTPRGGQYQLTLPDGSKVWLNAASSIRFPVAFAGRDRKVEITGEAYFEVTKNKSKPFKVSILPTLTEVEVFGTQFNINAYTDEATLKTTLVEGSVKVTKGGAIQMLSPGQQARINAAGQISLNASVNMDEVLAWKNGLFIFDHNDIREIMRQISKWYNVDVEYRGEPIHLTFSGIVSRNSNVSKTLQIMEQAGVKFIIEENKIIVM